MSRHEDRRGFSGEGVGHTGCIAKRLIDHFGSVAYALNASIDELTGVEEIGAIKAAKIRELLDVNLSEVS